MKPKLFIVIGFYCFAACTLLFLLMFLINYACLSFSYASFDISHFSQTERMNMFENALERTWEFLFCVSLLWFGAGVFYAAPDGSKS